MCESGDLQACSPGAAVGVEGRGPRWHSWKTARCVLSFICMSLPSAQVEREPPSELVKASGAVSCEA